MAAGRFTLLTGTHLAAGAIGATVAGIVTLHGAPLAWLQQDAQMRALQATPFEVSDQPNVKVIKNYGGGRKLYYVTFSVTAKNDSDDNLKFSYDLFNADILHLDSGDGAFARGQLLDAPPDPFDGVENVVPLTAAPDLKWMPLACTEYVNTNDKDAVALLSGAACPNVQQGGGMTGVYPPHAPNNYSNGLLVVAKPGDFIGLSTAFGVNDCGDEDKPNCSLSQEVVQLP